jgi:hypothetical protein
MIDLKKVNNLYVVKFEKSFSYDPGNKKKLSDTYFVYYYYDPSNPKKDHACNCYCFAPYKEGSSFKNHFTFDAYMHKYWGYCNKEQVRISSLIKELSEFVGLEGLKNNKHKIYNIKHYHEQFKL